MGVHGCEMCLKFVSACRKDYVLLACRRHTRHTWCEVPWGSVMRNVCESSIESESNLDLNAYLD